MATTRKKTQEPELQVLTAEQLRAECAPLTDLLPVPEFKPGFAIRVKGYSIGEIADIRRAATRLDSRGLPYHDEKQDRFLSVVAAIVEPKVSAEDAWVMGLADGLGDLIVEKALQLSGRERSAYEHLKEVMRVNPYVRRMYTICFELLGRAPSELRHIPEAELNAYLAAAEVAAEEAIKEKQKQTKEQSSEREE